MLNLKKILRHWYGQPAVSGMRTMNDRAIGNELGGGAHI